MAINKVIEIGRLTRDIGERDFSYTPNGKAKLNISIAVDNGYGDKKSVYFFDVTIWGKTAENLKPYLGKGKQVALTGRLTQDTWEKDGVKHSKVYITADEVQLLGGKDGRDQAERDGGHYEPAPAQDDGLEGNRGRDAVAGVDGGDFPEDLPF